jgi:hypothetical protein
MLDVIKNLIRKKLNHTTISTDEISPAKKQKIRKETTKPETKGRKPRNKTKSK